MKCSSISLAHACNTCLLILTCFKNLLLLLPFPLRCHITVSLYTYIRLVQSKITKKGKREMVINFAPKYQNQLLPSLSVLSQTVWLVDYIYCRLNYLKIPLIFAEDHIYRDRYAKPIYTYYLLVLRKRNGYWRLKCFSMR